jgi:prephenate dehydratase
MTAAARSKARAMRLGGSSLGEIATALGVSKSTAANWCRDVAVNVKNANGDVTRFGVVARRRVSFTVPTWWRKDRFVVRFVKETREAVVCEDTSW